MDNDELIRRLARLLDAYDNLTQDAIKIPVDKRMQFFNDAANYFKHMVAEVGGVCEVEEMGENGGMTVQVPVFDPATPEELAAFKVIMLHASAITIDARADGNACISITIPDIYCSVQQPDNQ